MSLKEMFLECKKFTPLQWFENLFLYIFALVIMPLGVVLTINSHLGASGYDALNYALSDKLGINTSIAIYATSIIVLIIAAIVRKSYPHIETFVSSFVIGFFTDIWKKVFADVQGTNFFNSLVLLCIGMVIAALAVACYMVAIFPTNPTDDLLSALKERGVRIRVAKISWDALCVVLAIAVGAIKGGQVGVGTIICTFAIGMIVDWFYIKIKKIVEKTTGKPVR